MKCIRFKMTSSGRRCAKFAKRGEFGSLGAPKRTRKPKKAARKCAATVGLRVKGPHPRSCPKSCVLPKVRGYKQSKEKAKFRSVHCRGRRG